MEDAAREAQNRESEMLRNAKISKSVKVNLKRTLAAVVVGGLAMGVATATNSVANDKPLDV